MQASETDVAIVGAGPVGVGLAIELGMRGVRTLVIDDGDGTRQIPTYNWFSCESAETLRRWQLADELRFSGFPSDFPHTTRYTTGIDGYDLVSFEQPSNRDSKGAEPYSPEGSLWAPNFYSEPVLRRKAASFPSVRLQFNARFVRFDQDRDGVTISLEDTIGGVGRSVRARFLVGCDGPKSVVRKRCGIELKGRFATDHQLAIHFRAPLQQISRHESCVHTWILKPEVRALLGSMNGHDRWVSGPLGLTKEQVESRSPMEWLCLILGPDVPIEILGANPWGGHYAVAERLREGRVFLAGDAAHLMWPSGGFGMNTGLGDARNLGWKLASALEDPGREGLLASYEIERRPVAIARVEGAGDRRAADGTFQVSPVLSADTEQGAKARAELAANIQGSERGIQWRTNLPGTDLGYSYESQICVPDGSEATPSSPDVYRPSARPGSRAPHFWLPDGRSSLDLFRAGFTLLSFSSEFDSEPLMSAAFQSGLTLGHECVDDPHAARTYGAAACIVRPDAFVAWRGNSLPATEASDIISRISGRVAGAYGTP